MTAIDAIVYPQGDTQASVTGRRTIIRRGWMSNDDVSGTCGLSAGVDYVTVMPLASGWKNIGCVLGMPWAKKSSVPATVSISCDSNTAAISVSGTPSGVAGLILTPDSSGVLPKGAVCAYAVSATDTAATIAAGLAACIPNATTIGPTITVPNATAIQGRVGGHSVVQRVTRRQQQLFQVTVWSGSYAARDTLGALIDSGLSGDPFIPVPDDGSLVLVEYAGGGDTDTLQTISIFRRDFRFNVFFDTTQQQTVAETLFGTVVLHTGKGPKIDFGAYPLPDGPILLTA